MSVRLDTVQTLGRNLKDWSRRAVPLICLARYLSDRPIDWFFFWIGWKVLCACASTSFAFRKGPGSASDGARVRSGRRRDSNTNTNTTTNSNSNADTEANAGNDPRRRRTARDVSLAFTSVSARGRLDRALPLTSLPSVVLSSVGCYLHPRDVLALDTVFRSSAAAAAAAAATVHPGTVGEVEPTRTQAQPHRRNYECQCDREAVLHDVWKRLWYRDYGDVLLQWKVAREAFVRSLATELPGTTGVPFDDDGCRKGNGDSDGGKWLEERLSNRLDEITTGTKCPARTATTKATTAATTAMTTTMTTTMRDFYFVFGECHIDYLLARKNTVDECYLGLHGHVFDFTEFAEYHPGLVEPILKECGGDATFYFEDLPHSSGARNIARRLCVLVNHGVVDHPDGPSRDRKHKHESESESEHQIESGWRTGLELVVGEEDSSELKRVLRSSNTRPPPPTNSNANRNNSSNNNSNKAVGRDRGRWMPHVLPRRRKLRKHPTLERIRTRFERERSEQRQRVVGSANHSRFWKRQRLAPDAPSKPRIYYDPFRREWIRWNS